MMIPKKIHVVWIGDESRIPAHCIDTWREKNPTFEVRVWGNDDLLRGPWANYAHMCDMAEANALAGVADLMRYEILVNHGGITVDADSECLRPLPDWLLEPREFATWESELLRPGLLTNAFLGSEPESPFFAQLVVRLNARPTVMDARPWITTGPTPLTELWHELKYPLTVYPGHYFTPNHYAGLPYQGKGQVFARQLWSSTRVDLESRGLALDSAVGHAH